MNTFRKFHGRWNLSRGAYGDRNFCMLRGLFIKPKILKRNGRMVAELTGQPDRWELAGDWRALPLTLMYRIHELPILLNEAGKHVDSAYDNDWPPDY